MHRRSIPLLTLLLAAAVAGSASASSRSTASFCSVSKSVAVQLVNTANAVKSSATLAQRQAELKTQFTTIRSAEGSLKTRVPGTLKTKLNTVLAFVNLVSAKLTAVHWNIAALAQNPSVAAAIEAASARADVAIPALKTYYRNTCHFKI